MSKHGRTSERAVGEFELGDISAELADIQRQSEAWIVSFKRHIATLRLHRDDLQRELACSGGRTQKDTTGRVLLQSVGNVHGPENLFSSRRKTSSFDS